MHTVSNAKEGFNERSVVYGDSGVAAWLLQELHCLREDIFEKKESLRSETDSSSERARKNW